jgi:hypothetical protein
MSQTTPPGPRHARFDVPEPPTTAIPTLIPNEFTDDTTQAIPIVPVQRTAPPPWERAAPVRPVSYGPPAGVHPSVATVPAAPRRRVLPAVLAGVTAFLLAAGIVVGVTGAAATDLTGQPPSSSATP